MRTNKELLEIVKETLTQLTYNSGLCKSIALSWVSTEEYNYLVEYIKSKRPFTWFYFRHTTLVDWGIAPLNLDYHRYWWEPGELESRVKFLNKLIAKQ